MKVQNLQHKVELRKSGKRKFQYSRSVIFLPALLIFLFVTANSTYTGFVDATKKALGFSFFAAVLIACLFLPDGYVKRPTTYLWKAVSGASFFYLAFLIYFLYLDKDSTVHVIKTYLDPSLSQVNYEETSYAQDCRIYAPDKQDPWGNVRHSFFDIFAVAHALGWFFKTLVCRDLKLVLLESILFEMIEYALRDVLNNFKECWWDHVVVDVFGCNLLGIILGFYFIDAFNLQRYKWSLRSAPMKDSPWSHFKYFFTHWDVSSLDTKAFSRTKKFLQIAWFAFFIPLNDLAVFFLKYIYQIPTDNSMVLFRTVLVGLLCINAAKQFYKFAAEKEPEIRVNCFLVNMILFSEWFIIYKHGSGDFAHAKIGTLGIVFLALIVGVFGLLLFKVLISDAICITESLLGRYRGKLQHNIQTSDRQSQDSQSISEENGKKQAVKLDHYKQKQIKAQ